MNATVVIFFVLAIVAVVGAVSLIIQRHPIHSALSLIVVMVALAGLYLLMGAEFVAAVQIIVYGGAIMVLFIFVIMLLNAGVEERTNFSKLALYAGIPLAVAVTGLIAAALINSKTTAALPPAAPITLTSTRTLSTLLFTDFVYPFELTSFLILVAILGALVLAQREE
jgi:NADH-quinone oxidoreductase subunit J